MASIGKRNTGWKAPALKLDQTHCNLSAEIGAGLEVVQWFLAKGDSAEFVAKSISAYKKEAGDHLYGFSAPMSKREFDVRRLPIAAPARIPHVIREAV